MVARNPNLAKLHAGYLFPVIAKRKKAFLEKHPEVKLISLGIGDTTEPIPPHIASTMQQKAEALATQEGYSGYGPEQGHPDLRKAIATLLYTSKIDPDNIFISDGSKCDIGRLQILFGKNVTVAIQDPSYPVYVDTSVIVGQTQNYNAQLAQYDGIHYMTCNPGNHFFPDLDIIQKSDLIYFCSPNNPTGAVATREQLKSLVDFAKKNKSLLLFDAAYACFIQNPDLPKSIYEIEGAEEVAIELGSFSKMVGFTGVRLAWTIIPKTVKFDDGHPVHTDWSRINSTFFNGASNIAQAGGNAVLDPEGLNEMKKLIHFYMENTKILKSVFEEGGYEVYGGTDTPYIWVKFPGLSSWDAFEELMTQAHIVCTPGSGFGPAGEGFLRFSAFGHRKDILEAAERLKTYMKFK
jgi:LL-diaminopimelate aminotransferase